MNAVEPIRDTEKILQYYREDSRLKLKTIV